MTAPNDEAPSVRPTLRLEVEGISIVGAYGEPAEPTGKPLIVALHGGAYRGLYFDVATAGHPSFMDLAIAEGQPVISFDRPGYGASSSLAADENTFERQAELLSQAIEQAAAALSASRVALVGHSIGGMIALTIASLDAGLPLVAVSATGMGAVIPPGGPAEGLAAVAAADAGDIILLPPEQADQVMFGPSWTVDPAVFAAAHASYAPAPAVELIAAPKWATDKLPGLAPRVTVPVHNALAQFDALWDSSPQSIEQFAALFTATPFVDASIARATGHSIDHHRLGHALHQRQLAFFDECLLIAGSETA
jgi:pimeloyl-ACP methyl ester carboxylesterase